MSKRIFLSLLILSAALAIFFLLVETKPERVNLARTEKLWPVKVETIELKEISPEITLYGRIESPRRATLNAAISADIDAIAILEGDKVEQDQVLLRLQQDDAQLQLIQRQADLTEIEALIQSEQARYQRDIELITYEESLLALANQSVERAKKLDKTRLVTRSSVDDAIIKQQQQHLKLRSLEYDISEHPSRLAGLKARLLRAEALVKQAQLDLDRTLITAPFPGRIASLDVSLGDRVRQGDKLLTIYDFAYLEVRAQIPRRHLKQVRRLLNQKQTLTANTIIDDQQHEMTLTRLSGETRQDSGGVDGLFRFVDDQDSLRLGAFLELSLSLKLEPNVVEIPFSALYGLDQIYRVENDSLIPITIERVGEYRDSENKKKLLVRSAWLQTGDKILITQLPNAITGLPVKIISND